MRNPDIVPIILRADLFGNPVKSGAQISPDGSFLIWLAPVDGVMNLIIAPYTDLASFRPLTFESIRPVRQYVWARDCHHVLVIKDKGGDEDWHVYAVNIETARLRDLTPYEGITAAIAKISPKYPDAVLVTHNHRDKRFPDLYRIDIATGAATMLAENPGIADFWPDDDFCVRLANRVNDDGSTTVMRPDGAGHWSDWLHIEPEDLLGTMLSGHFTPDGRALLMLDSRGRDTAALAELDLKTGEASLIAVEDRADIAGLLIDNATKRPLA